MSFAAAERDGMEMSAIRFGSAMDLDRYSDKEK